MMSATIKRRIPMVLIFLVGIIVLFDWFIPTPVGSSAAKVLRDWNVIIVALAIGLGAFTMYRTHYRHLVRRTPGQWPYSAATLVVCTMYILVGLGLGVSAPTYQWMYSNVILPLGGAVFASVAFYLASASYRVMRVRSIEAALLLVSGLIMLLATAPIGSVIWSGFLTTGNWLMDTVVTGVYRAFTIGIALGFILTGVRTLLGLETAWLGRRE